MNVKQGDLAIAIHAGNPGNIGRIFEVIRFVGQREFNGISGPAWLVRAVGIKATTACGGQTSEALAFDAWLRPISGIPDQEETTKQEPVAA